MNRELFEKAKNNCGAFFRGGVSEKIIEEIQEELETRFSNDYCEFLKEFGEGGVNGTYISGVVDENESYIVNETKNLRCAKNLAKEYIVIAKRETKFKRWRYCLDTKRMQEGECPIVKYDLDTGEIRNYKRNFTHLMDSEHERLYDKSIKKDCIIEQPNLPFGMGYKTCWMMIENASQLEIADVLLQGDKVEMEYKKGVDVVAHASFKDRKVLVTADYNNCNYIIGDAVHKIFHNYEKLRRELIDTVRTVVYATNRVSNIHAFAFFLHGNLKRMFYFSEEELINEGNIREEEEQLGLCLPKSFDELHEHWNDGKFSDIDEELIVSLAKQQIGIDVEQYPYENVIIGELNLD